MKNYIVGLGEILFDCLPEGKKLGGAPANFAFHAAQFGLNGIAVSAIGQDDWGQEILDELAGKQLEVHLEKTDYPTGRVNVLLDEKGVPTYDIQEGVAYDNIPWTPAIEEIAKQTKAVCYGSLAQRNPVSRATIQQFLATMPADSVKIFDINLRQHFYSKELIMENLEKCNILKINDDEIEIVGQLFGYEETSMEAKCQKLLATYNLQMVILTCGTNGSYVFTADKQTYQPTPKVEVADTVGAGDSFTGAFCAAILQGKPVEEAHRLAVQVSAYVCSQHGAMPTLPENIKA